MNHCVRLTLLALSAALIVTGCRNDPSSQMSVAADHDLLVGAWRSKVVFRSGALAEMKDLEFLYAYNAGGTMTESSNYDEAANSSPPAYGTTKAPGPGDASQNSGDWWPAGHGVLTETITLSDDGQTYVSAIKLTTFDKTGTPIAGGGEGTGAGTRLVF